MKPAFGRWISLNEKTSGVTRCPGPLEVESTEMSAYVKNFTDKKQPRLVVGFHRLGANTVRIYTTQRYLGRAIALCGGGLQ